MRSKGRAASGEFFLPSEFMSDSANCLFLCVFMLQVLGMGEAWKGGDVGHSIGGGQKVRLLKEAMEAVADQEDLVVLSVDRYDDVFKPFLFFFVSVSVI